MRPLRSALATLGALLLVLAAGTTSARAADDPNAEAIRRIGACMSGGGHGDMLILLDRSGSLADTDPVDARVDAARYLVGQMATFAGQAGWQVDVAVAGFDTQYQRTLDWTPVTADSRDTIDAALDDFRDQDAGVDTDYWNALAGARRELSARTATDVTHCQFLVWFTDGEYNLNVRPDSSALRRWGGEKPYASGNTLGSRDAVDEALRAGRTDLCRGGGVADQLRAQGIVTLAVGLSAGTDKPDFTLLRGLATGQGTACGELTDPAPGAFYTAADLDGMFQAFDQFSIPGQVPTTREGGICVRKVCPEGSHQFVLDGGIGGVHILATTGAVGQWIVLTDPSGRTQEVRPGSTDPTTTDLSGGRLTATWLSDRSVSIDLTRVRDDGWAGPWKVTFLAESSPTGTSRSSIRLYGDLTPVWIGADSARWYTGTAGPPLTFELRRRDGSAVDLARASRRTTLSADLIRADGTTLPIATDIAKDDIGKPVTVDLTDVAPGPATLRLTLDVTTDAWTGDGETVAGTNLEPQTADYPVTLLPPADYPQLPPKVSFGSVETLDPITLDVPITGDGCVWLDGEAAPTSLPEGTGSVRVTSPVADQAGCVSGALPLTATADALGNGLASGTLTVLALPAGQSPSGAAQAVAVPVAYELEMRRPADVAVLGGVLIGVTLLGVAIPLGLLYLVKWLTARIPGTAVVAGSLRGQVTDEASFLDAGVPLRMDQLHTVVLAGTDRRRIAVDGKVLRARVGLSPTEPGHVVVDQPGPGAGSTRPATVRGRARLPLAVQGSWSVGLDPADPRRGDVTVSFFTSPGAPGWAELTDDCRRRVREVVAALRAGLPPVDPAAGRTPGPPAAAPGATRAAPPDSW